MESASRTQLSKILDQAKKCEASWLAGVLAETPIHSGPVESPNPLRGVFAGETVSRQAVAVGQRADGHDSPRSQTEATSRKRTGPDRSGEVEAKR
jgi:hypothetical protein